MRRPPFNIQLQTLHILQKAGCGIGKRLIFRIKDVNVALCVWLNFHNGSVGFT